MSSEFKIAVRKLPIFSLTNSDAINGNTRVGITLNTIVKLNKFYKDDAGNRVANAHHGRVVKVQTLGVMLATEKTVSAFQTATNRKLVAAGEPGDFVVAEHNYADKVDASAVMVHRTNGQVYLRYFPNSVTAAKVHYLLDGQPIEWGAVTGKGAPRKPATVTGSTTGQAVEKPQIRQAKLESVQSLRMFGKEYTGAQLVG